MTSYSKAGVNLEGAAKWVSRLKTLSPEIGGFGGFYPYGDDFLVASTDGVGTKLKIAIALDKHDTIGIDLVAMNVNDILTSGAKPLFFLDYLAVSKLEEKKLEEILSGIQKGCEEAGCLLIGGETAQMGDFYPEGHYDAAGFAVGVVRKKDRVDGSSIEKGDYLVGLPSSGAHSNGFSLIRKVLGERDESLLTPTKIYVKRVHELMGKVKMKGMAHITGGAFGKNIPRMLPEGLGALIYGGWPVPEVFSRIQKAGGIATEEMRRVFNLGIGFILCMSAEEARSLCKKEGDCFLVGEVVSGKGVLWR
jgi:phosphoribosylformylglycinamidine cyclo-ligase